MPMRALRMIAFGSAVLLLGAAVGFVAALLRPRHYAEFVGSRQEDPQFAGR